MKTFNLPIGTKVETLDKDGYFITPLCGVISKTFDGYNDAIVKSFDGSFVSTQYYMYKVASIQIVK